MALAPWVHPTWSGEFKSLYFVPDSVLGNCNKLFGFINSYVNPTLNFSLGIVSSLKGSVAIKKLRRASDAEDEDKEEEEDYDSEWDYASYERTGDVYFKVVMRNIFAEDPHGAGDEALQCMKRGANVSWGCFDDFDEAVPRIFDAEMRRAGRSAEEVPAAPVSTVSEAPPVESGPVESGTGRHADQNGLLRVLMYFAEDDFFIGKKGRKWMDTLWRSQRGLKGTIQYESVVVEGSDHDSIAEVQFGVVDNLFRLVREEWSD